jgi:hypothetical protein
MSTSVEHNFLVDGIQKMVYNKKEILVIDYSNRKEAEMLKRITALGELIKKENKHVLMLAIFNDKSFATPTFMRQNEKVTREVGHLIEKKALIGLNDAKKIILEGQNKLFNSNCQSFESMEEAVQYLLGDTSGQ